MLFLLTIGFNELVTYFGNDIYLPALPTIMAYFNISEMQAQLSLFLLDFKHSALSTDFRKNGTNLR